MTNREPQALEAEVPLEKGENFHTYCENRLRKRYPAALIRRPGNTLDLRRLLATYLDDSQDSGEATIRYEGMEIAGPIRPLPRQERFLRSLGHASDGSYLESTLLPVAERAFRRPLTQAERRNLVDTAMEHMEGAPAPEYGVHYGIRRILLSPQFLYRETGTGALDEYGLASRLAYFLWSSMPDKTLLQDAAAGRLSSEQWPAQPGTADGGRPDEPSSSSSTSPGNGSATAGRTP